jgi:hypothetical protein
VICVSDQESCAPKRNRPRGGRAITSADDDSCGWRPYRREMLPSRPLLAALVAGATLLSASAAADASTNYRVDSDLVGEYHMTAAPPDGTAAVNVGFTTESDQPKVTIEDGVVEPTRAGISGVSHVETMGHFTGSGHSADCSGTTGNMIGHLGVSVAPFGVGQLALSPFDGLEWTWACTGFNAPSGLALVNIKDSTGAGPFDAIVATPDASSPGIVVRDVDRTVEGSTCPLHSQYTLSCTVHITGTVTFIREGTPAPRVPPGTYYTPGTAPEAHVIGLPRDARRVLVQVRCGEQRCPAVRVEVFAWGAAGAASKHHARPLATRRLSLAQGASKRVAIRFSKKARKRIKRAGGVRIVVSEGSARRTLTVRLPHRAH